MKKIIYILAALIAFSTSAIANPPEINLVKESALAILWMQDGAEYKAIVHQSFNSAKRAVSKEMGTKKVFVRVDDVLLDNTPYAAWLLKADQRDTETNRNRWYNSMDAEAVDGAVSFVNFLNAKRAEVKLVTSRDKNTWEATLENLEKVGMSGFGKYDIMTEEELDNYIGAGGEYTLVVTNRMNDFDSTLDEKNYEERKMFADDSAEKFGAKWIVIPNLLYGEFETSLVKNYESLNINRKSEIRKETLNDWKGTKEFDTNYFGF